MIRSLRNRRVVLCLLASLAVHMLFLWAYQRWAAQPVLRVLRPARFELAPSLEPQRFEPAPRATVPDVVMEQLRLAELLMEAPLPEDAAAVPSVGLEGLAPAPGLEADPGLGPAVLPGDTLSYDSALADLYRRKLVELQGRRIRVLPLADATSEAGRRRARAREIIDRAIKAMGGLERLQAIRDKRIRVERWDGERQIWKSVGTRSYLRGERYRLDIGPNMARGHDGHRSWYLYYGLLLPPRDERYNAERWDFLSRFRGDGVVVEFVGHREMQFRTLAAVRVIDTKFGRQRLAYFGMEDSLLYAEVEGGRTTTYREYRQTQGVLTPFEVRGGYRWHTELNTGLAAARFDVPEEASWELESVRTAVFEHVPVPPGGAAGLRLQVENLTQGERSPDNARPGLIAGGGPWLMPPDAYLLDTYMKRKLQAGGVLAGADPPEWRLAWRVEGFRRVKQLRDDEAPPIGEGHTIEIATLKIAVRVQSLRDGDWWEGFVDHRWIVPHSRGRGRRMAPQGHLHRRPRGRCRHLASDPEGSVGMKQLLDARAAAAQPASTPSGSSSGVE